MPDLDWAAIRAEFPALANWTFLNTASFGQLPRRGVDLMNWHFRHRDEFACHDFLSWFDDMDRLRGMVSQLVDCEPADVGFLPNTSHALSLMLGGIEWEPGDRIVALEHEFPNNIYYPSVLENAGVHFLEVPWENFYASIGPRTRLVLMSSVNYVTGFRPPLEEVSRFLRERDVLLFVDGTQSVGALPFSMRRIRPDMLAVHGYKWMNSPNGAAFICVHPDLRRKLAPNVIGWRSDRGWRSVESLSHGAPEFVDSAEKYEGGMLNFPSLYGMGASLEMMLELGPEAIENRVMGLAAYGTEVIRSVGGGVQHEGSQILAARFPGVEAANIQQLLYEKHILTSARHGNLRISVHFYNDERDLEALRAALREVLPA